MSFIDEIQSFNNDYLFDGNNVYHWLKPMIIKHVRDEDIPFIVSKIIRYYIEYLTSNILGNVRASNSSRLSFILEIDQWLGTTTSERQDYIFKMLDVMLGNFIRNSLGRNLSYLTHQINCYISPDLMDISILIKPTSLSDFDKYQIYLDNVEEEGGWVTDKLRRRKYDHDEYN